MASDTNYKYEQLVDSELDSKSEPQQPTFKNDRSTKRRANLLFLLAVLLAISFFNLGFFLRRPYDLTRESKHPIPRRKCTQIHQSPPPYLTHHPDIRNLNVQKPFQLTNDFNPPGGRSNTSDAAWHTRHKRFVVIDEPRKYNLPASLEAPAPHPAGSQIYAISAFHQFHCLRLMRYAWYGALVRGGDILNHPEDIPNWPPGTELREHIDHCFDMMRQTIECLADPGLEPFVKGDGHTPQRGASGYGANHVCRDFDGLMEWVEEHDIPQMGTDWYHEQHFDSE